MSEKPKHGIFIGLPGTDKVPTYFRGKEKYYFGNGYTITKVSSLLTGLNYFNVMAYTGPELLIQWGEE